MEFNKEELIRQYTQSIYDGGEYVEIKSLMKTINNDRDLLEAVPITTVSEHASTPLTTALLLVSMEKTIKDIISEDEDVRIAYEFSRKHIDEVTKIEIERKENKEDE